MSDKGHSDRASTRLGLGEHGWGLEPTTPFLDGESFANAKFGGRLVPLNPLLSRDRSPGRQTVASGEGRSVAISKTMVPRFTNTHLRFDSGNSQLSRLKIV
jgi:hypothetical protein